MMDMAMDADQPAPDAETVAEIKAAQDAESAHLAPAMGARGRKPRSKVSV